MTKTAYAITTVHIVRDKDKGVEVFDASTKAKPSIFEVSDEHYAELEKLGAVRAPEKAEIGLFNELQKTTTGQTVPEAAAITEPSARIPDSGAAGDPKSAPKSKSKTADDDI